MALLDLGLRQVELAGLAVVIGEGLRANAQASAPQPPRERNGSRSPDPRVGRQSLRPTSLARNLRGPWGCRTPCGRPVGNGGTDTAAH